MFWLFTDLVVIKKETMSWLFKDPINSGLAQFDHAQSNSKKWSKGWKDQITPNEFFSRKTTNKILMYLLAPFILQNFNKIPRDDPELWGCIIFRPKMAHLSRTKYFCYKSLLLFSSTYWPFSSCKKILAANPELWGCIICGPKVVHLPQTIFFLKKIINIIFIYQLAPFILQNF